MKYTLLIFSIVNPKNLSFRYFVSDKDWYEELHMKIEYNMYGKAQMEDAIVNRDLKEISFEEIKDYEFSNTMNIAVYDGFDAYNSSNVMHYTVDEDAEEYETLLFGCEKGYCFEIDKTVDVNDIVRPIISDFSGKYDSEAETIYLIPMGGSLDDEYALSYNVFSNEKDADLFLKLYEKGEIAPYIFLNADYDVAVQMHPLFTDIECILPDKLSDLLKTKTVVLKQSVFAGKDIYN